MTTSYQAATKLGTKIYKLLVPGYNQKELSHKQLENLFKQVDQLGNYVYVTTKNDIAWRWYEADLLKAKRYVYDTPNTTYALGALNKAVQLIAGAAQRAEPKEFDHYYVSRLNGKQYAWPVKVIRMYQDGSGWAYVRGLGGRFKGREFTIVGSELYNYKPTGVRVMREGGVRENPIEQTLKVTIHGKKYPVRIVERERDWVAGGVAKRQQVIVSGKSKQDVLEKFLAQMSNVLQGASPFDTTARIKQGPPGLGPYPVVYTKPE